MPETNILSGLAVGSGDSCVLTEGARLFKPGLHIFALAVGVDIAKVGLEEFGSCVFAGVGL